MIRRSRLGALGILFAGLLTTPARAELQQIVVVFKTHFDIGYSDLARNVVQQYRTSMIDRAMGVIEANRKQPAAEQFAWTVPGWPMSQILWEGQTPRRRRAVERALRDGHLVMHALPFTTHTETLELEELVRGMGYSSRLSRRYGLELPRDAKMTDVPCHSWAIVTLLKHAGVEFLHVGCNDASMPPRVPLLFRWEGPDGSRLLTMLTNTYGTWPFPPADWPYKTWLALLHTGDNAGPPAADHVRGVLQTYREKLPGVKVHIGRMADFADAIEAENPELPVVRGDMVDTWIYGPMSAPAGCKTARNVRPALPATESLHTQLAVWGVAVPEIASVLAKAYESSLLYGEHTWGLATQHYVKLVYGEPWRKLVAKGMDKNHRYLEESWDEHEAYINSTEKLIRPLLQKQLGTLAASVGVKGPRIVVYNPLPWKRSGIVTVRPERTDLKAVSAVDSDDATEVVTDGETVRFLARDVPSMGYRTYVPVDGAGATSGSLKCDQTAGKIESPFFTAVMDPQRGAIRSLIDRRSGRELVDTSAPHGFGQYLYQRHGREETTAFLDAYVPKRFHGSHGDMHAKTGNLPADVPGTAVGPTDMTLHFEHDAMSVSAVMTSKAAETLPHDVLLRLTLYRDVPAADLSVSIGKPPESWPESGWICLPLQIDRPHYRLGRLGSIVDPLTDVVEGTNFHLFWLNSGMAVYDAAGRGVGICPIDSPLVSLGEPGMLRYSTRYEPKRPWVYVNLFNNNWNTNFRSWWGGEWTSRVRLWAIEEYDAEEDLITPGWATRSPLLAAAFDGPAGALPPTRTGLSLSRQGVLLTAFGPNPDGEGLVLRLWEQAGQSGPCSVTLPEGLDCTAVQPVDLRGRPVGDPLPVRGRTFSADVPAYAPVSFIIDEVADVVR